jgi:beta-phosphoglucomutase-like phosphatase (HAD superfamily)
MYTSFTGFSTILSKIKENFGLDNEVEDLIQRSAVFLMMLLILKDLELLEGVRDLIIDLHTNGVQLILASSASKVTIARVLIDLV